MLSAVLKSKTLFQLGKETEYLRIINTGIDIYNKKKPQLLLQQNLQNKYIDSIA